MKTPEEVQKLQEGVRIIINLLKVDAETLELALQHSRSGKEEDTKELEDLVERFKKYWNRATSLPNGE